MNQTKLWFWVVIIALSLFIVSSNSAAQSFFRYNRICLQDIFIIEKEIPPIIVGCEVVDCCPGCPGPDFIDWRIRFASDSPVEEIILQFENLSPDDAKRLELKGNARWIAENQLLIGKGEILIRGFSIDPSKKPIMAIPRVAQDKADIEKYVQTFAKRTDLPQKDMGEPEKDIGELELVVEQMLGPVLVNRFELGYRFYICFPLIEPEVLVDRIDLDNNAGNDNAVVFLDARRSTGCVNDEVRRGNNIIGVGSVLSNGACDSEAAVFSDGDAVQVIPNVTVWSDSLGDVLNVDLTPDRWQVPVTVWIAMPQAQRAATLTQAQNEIAQADNLFDSNHGGIMFTTSVNYQTLTNNANINTITNTGTTTWTTGFCNTVPNVTGNAAIFNAGQLNVYYVNSAFTGWYCPGSNVIAIGTNAQPESLTHEFGHAFSLQHTQNVDYDGDGINDFPTTNIMWGGGAGRTIFTEAQCFRMTVNNNSVLNTNGVRTTGITRNCPDATISVTCPWLGLDVIPNN